MTHSGLSIPFWFVNTICQYDQIAVSCTVPSGSSSFWASLLLSFNLSHLSYHIANYFTPYYFIPYNLFWPWVTEGLHWYPKDGNSVMLLKTQLSILTDLQSNQSFLQAFWDCSKCSVYLWYYCHVFSSLSDILPVLFFFPFFSFTFILWSTGTTKSTSC